MSLRKRVEALEKQTRCLEWALGHHEQKHGWERDIMIPDACGSNRSHNLRGIIRSILDFLDVEPAYPREMSLVKKKPKKD